MARPTKHPDEKRDQRFNLRFTAAELAHVETQARLAGVGPHEFLRRRALGYVVPPAPTQRRAVEETYGNVRLKTSSQMCFWCPKSTATRPPAGVWSGFPPPNEDRRTTVHPGGCRLYVRRPNHNPRGRSSGSGRCPGDPTRCATGQPIGQPVVWHRPVLAPLGRGASSRQRALPLDPSRSLSSSFENHDLGRLRSPQAPSTNPPRVEMRVNGLGREGQRGEIGTGVRAVAERLSLRPAAPAEVILLSTLELDFLGHVGGDCRLAHRSSSLGGPF